MSSPLAIDHNAVPQTPLAGMHPLPSHDDHCDALAQRIALHIGSIVPQGRAHCLDVGCGDMTLADGIHALVPRTIWRCIDVQRVPRAVPGGGRTYCWFDGRTLPHATKEFDVALLSDVLHQGSENATRLLAEAGRVARHVLVKDHFEHDPSQTALRIRSFVGTNGARVQERYLTREAFVRLVDAQGFVITALDCELSRDEYLPLVRTALKPEFIAVLSRS